METLNRTTIRLDVTDFGEDGKPAVTLTDADGNKTDILPSLERLSIDLHAEGAWATIVVKADVEFDFEMKEINIQPNVPSALEGLTAEELDAVINSTGMSETAGTALIRHLGIR